MTAPPPTYDEDDGVELDDATPASDDDPMLSDIDQLEPFNTVAEINTNFATMTNEEMMMPTMQKPTTKEVTTTIRPPTGLPAPVSTLHYPAIAGDAAEIEERIRANGQLRLADLDRVNVPGAGGRMWSVPTQSGKFTEAPVLDGIIAWWTNRRAFWKFPLGEGETRHPDCSSPDAVHGDGEPGGECALCEHALFGSARNGRGQACRLTRELFLFLAEQHLPLIVVVSPASHAAVAKFMRRLPIPYYQAVVRLGLEQVRGDSGITYSVIVPEFVAPLDGPSAERFAAIHRQLEKFA